MEQRIISCDETECLIAAEHFLDYFPEDEQINSFDRVIIDVSRVYENAVLMGALAASKYILPPVEPRVTFDVDVILPKKEFNDFLEDEIPPDKLEILDACFETSDSTSHSLRHRKTRVYVDLLSEDSRPVSRKLVRRTMENPDETTNFLVLNGSTIGILKPELIIAMKLHRYAKNPRSEKALTDRLDIIKMLKSFHDRQDLLDPESVRAIIRRREVKYFEEMIEDVACEMCEQEN